MVAFSTWSTPDELDWLLQDSTVRMLIALDRFGDNDFAAALADRWQSRRYPALRHVALLGDNLPHGFLRYDTLLAAAPLPPPGPGATSGASDDAIIIYTSGSSSRPKSVPL